MQKFRLSYLSLLVPLIISCGGKSFPVSSAGSESEELKHCIELSEKKKYDEAVQCLDVYKSRHPSVTASAGAELLIADNLFRQKEYLLAASSYQEFIRNNSYNDKVDYAYFQSGVSYLKAMPKAIDRDQQYLDLAVQNLEIVVRSFPNYSRASEALALYRKAKGMEAKKHYSVGRFYYKYSEYLASISRFETVVNDFPNSGYDEKSYYYLIEGYLKTNQKHRAKEVWSSFKERFPESQMVRKLEDRVSKS